ncbi:hypothetical protein QQX98_011658 [Neonectria punicea]|uniref:Uncharacterized protein n=1 Tax=Neonectria punicea TaxID=979145 RepID=A0ABR1GLE1_9HYPO
MFVYPFFVILLHLLGFVSSLLHSPVFPQPHRTIKRIAHDDHMSAASRRQAAAH